MSVSEVVAGAFFFGVFSKLNDEKKKKQLVSVPGIADVNCPEASF